MREFIFIAGCFCGVVGMNIAFDAEIEEFDRPTPIAEPRTISLENKHNFDDFLRAIRIVESNDTPMAIGDGGKAIGAYQIWKSYWKDAVEFDSSLDGRYEDCYNVDYASRVVRAYMSRYATAERLGHEPTFEDMARIHNGGCNIHKKKGTEAWNNTTNYWIKVQKQMNQ